MALEKEIDEILEPTLNKEALDRMDIKPFLPHDVDKTVIQVTKANLNNIGSSDGLVYDSELTFRGTIRKRKFKVGRVYKNRTKYNTVRNKRKQDILKNAQLALLTYAPMYTNIYTSVNGYGKFKKFLYIDIYSVHDNRLYKITKLVSKILGLKLMSPVANYVAHDVVRVPYGAYYEENRMKVQHQIEEDLIRQLSEKMFGVASGYFWQTTGKLVAVDVPKPVVEKSYKIETVVDNNKNSDTIDTQEVKKNFRLR